MGALALVCALAAASQKKDELYRQAKAAEDAENLAEAARLYCQVANLDPEYKDARTMCEVMRQEADRLAKHYQDLFNKGVSAFQQGNLDDAEQNFKNVRKCPLVSESQQYLAKIKSARQAKAAAEAEKASSAAFDRGEQAFHHNDFTAAKAAFAQVTGVRQTEAQTYLGTISRYELAMSAGDQAAALGDVQGALTAYRNASALESNGPGDPAGKIAQIEKRIQADIQAAAEQREQEEQLRQPSPAAGTPKKPDLRDLLNEAALAGKRGDKTGAKAKYQRVLATDPKNKIAIRGIAQLEGVSVQTAATTRSEALLATGLRDFYAGDYLIAEVRLQDYLHSGGARKGLAYFFLGTCKLSRHYISDRSEEAEKLLAEAQESFRMAAQSPEFVPPGAEYVSPKVLDAYVKSTK